MKRLLLVIVFCCIPLTTGCTKDQVCQWLYDHGQTNPKLGCIQADPTEYTPVDIP